MKNQIRIDYQAIGYNAKKIAQHTGKKIFAVVKNNAYNMGMKKVLDTLISAGVEHFAVASAEEALEIKKYRPNIYALQFNPADAEAIETARKHQIALSIAGMEWFTANMEHLQNIPLHLKINVGMNRFGVAKLEEACKIVEICRSKNLRLEGLFTHFAQAEENDLIEHRAQVEKFTSFYKELGKTHRFEYTHCENTASIVRLDERLSFCSHVRPGIMLFGYSSVAPIPCWLLPSLFVSSQVVGIRDVAKGAHLGYGVGYTAQEDETIAVLPIGYGDGIMRIRKIAPVFINGAPYPIAGNISMSHTFVRVDASIKIGDHAELYGKNIRPDTIAGMGAAANSEQMAALHLQECSG